MHVSTLVLLLLCTCAAMAQVYVNSVQGSDTTGNGTITGPFASLSRINWDANSTVFIAAGSSIAGIGIVTTLQSVTIAMYGAGALPIITSTLTVDSSSGSSVFFGSIKFLATAQVRSATTPSTFTFHNCFFEQASAAYVAMF